MDKLSPTEYGNALGSIDRKSCGAVYPLSVAENIQDGDIYTDGKAALFRHCGGFAFLYGEYDENTLEWIYDNFLSPDSITIRRFVLFTADDRAIRFFTDKENISVDKRYFFEYPENAPAREILLPDNIRLCEITEELCGRIQGFVVPSLYWNGSSNFLKSGKGYCAMDGDIPAAWAFSSAVSADETDIGVETRSDHRQWGLGAAVAARMVQYCLETNKRPVWACNAANAASNALAVRTGFIKSSECHIIRKS